MKTNLSKGAIKAFLAQQSAAVSASQSSSASQIDEAVQAKADFIASVQGVKPITQDTIAPLSGQQQKPMRRDKASAATRTRQQGAEFVFSDGFEAHFPDTEALLWHVGDKPSAALTKRLRKGDFIPEYQLDCHGLTKADAKNELAALLSSAYRQDIPCVAIMHGHGSGVLKRAIPNWLIQYPHVVGFCQAPKQWGGKAAILVLLNIPELAHRI